MVKTLKEKKWKRGMVEAKCLYCRDNFIQRMPWQKYCCASHKTMDGVERRAKNASPSN